MQIGRIIIAGYLLLTLAMPATAQELDAKITVNHNQIQGTDASVFDNLQQTLEQFVNDRQWTNLQFQKNERISCNFNITVTKYDPSTGLFTCKALIQANRPVFNSSYTTTLYNNTDNDFNFRFAQYDQLEWNEETIDNQLTALFGYYAFLIIGLNLDSFSPMGGEAVLQFQFVPGGTAAGVLFHVGLPDQGAAEQELGQLLELGQFPGTQLQFAPDPVLELFLGAVVAQLQLFPVPQVAAPVDLGVAAVLQGLARRVFQHGIAAARVQHRLHLAQA